MDPVGAGIAELFPATSTPAKTHPSVEMARVSSRGRVRRGLLLFSLASWGCWQLGTLSETVPKQCSSEHERPCFGTPVEYVADPLKDTCSPQQIPAAAPYLRFPGIIFAAADDHVPSEPELQYRLPMYFENSPHVIFLLRNWYTDTNGSYALCCCATLLLGLLSVLLKAARRQLEIKLQESSSKVDARPGGDQQHTQKAKNVLSAAGACNVEEAGLAAQPASSTAPAAPVDTTTTKVAGEITRFAEKGTACSPAGRGGSLGEGLEDLHQGKIDVPEQASGLHDVPQQRPRTFERCDMSSASASRGNMAQGAVDSAQSIHIPVLLDTAAAGAPPPDGVEESCCTGGQRQTHSDKPGDSCNTVAGEKKCKSICRIRIGRHKVESEGSWVPAALQAFPVGPNAARAVAAFCNYSLDYLLMLLAMTFNVGIILCLFAGIAIGFLLIGHHMLPPPVQSRSHAFRGSTPNRYSSGLETAGSSASSSRDVDNPRGTPISRAGCSAAVELESDTCTHREADKRGQMPGTGGVIFAKESVHACSRAHPVAAHDDAYWCTYTGTAGDEGQGEQRDKGKECHFNKRQQTDEGRTEKGFSAAATSGDNSSTSDKETGSRSSNAVNVSCLRAADASSGARAARAYDGVGASREFPVTPRRPVGEDANNKARKAALQPNGSSDKNALCGTAADNSRTSLCSRGDGNECGEKWGCTSNVKKRTDSPLVMPPVVKGTESSALSVHSPAAGRRHQLEGPNRRQELRRPHLLAGSEAQFQRRPSDCYDLLTQAENLRKLYPTEVAVPWRELVAERDLKL